MSFYRKHEGKIVLVLVFFLVFLFFSPEIFRVPAEERLEKEGDYLYFTISPYEVAFMGYTGWSRHLVIPEEIDGKKVTSIRGMYTSQKYWDTKGMKSRITSLTIPGSVERIDEEVLSKCRKLKKVVWKDGAAKVPAYAFAKCRKLKEVVLPSTVEVIEDKAFYCCDKLKSIVIPDEVTRIEGDAFWCSGLERVVFGEKLSYIGDEAFGETPWLMSQEKENGMVIVRDILMDGTDCEGEVKIPETVRCIAGGAFRGNEKITALIVPGNVKTIGNSAFSKCKNLRIAELYDGVEIVDDRAFSSCKSLTDITFPDTIHTVGVSVLDKDWLELQCAASGKSYYYIGDILVYAGEYERHNLMSEYILENAKSIAPEALAHSQTDRWSENFIFPLCGEVIGKKAGYYLHVDENLYIPEGVKKIENYAFGGCSVPGVAVIPQTVEEIGTEAFRGAKINELSIAYGVETISEKAFFVSKIENINIPGSVKKLGAYMLATCGRLKEVQLQEGITYIPEGMFQDCKSLEYIEIPKSVEYIERWAFKDCNATVRIKNKGCVIIGGEESIPGGVVYGAK